MNAETLRELFDTLADTPGDVALAAALADACQEADGAVLADCLAREMDKLQFFWSQHWKVLLTLTRAMRSGSDLADLCPPGQDVIEHGLPALIEEVRRLRTLLAVRPAPPEFAMLPSEGVDAGGHALDVVTGSSPPAGPAAPPAGPPASRRRRRGPRPE